MRTFVGDRKVPHTEDIVRLEVTLPLRATRPKNDTSPFFHDGVKRGDAERALEEMAYAVSWHRGLPQADAKGSKRPKPTAPDKWALVSTTKYGQVAA